ncbi:acetyltransferase-like isoleucine patch superfamily enzyme [Knoellia remsis]|uniref:Acetyltransferase-like isoleucine patch superfamily enzyme n=1 Tax=Knoellia remsis TaxID=407159 RepID=A0A2T0UZ70_9MICO|nr:acyltransferase [Knoellia remsis]PRY63219.1 acetyltransferase-like isoleucine patch superfamily enzyme [Knoellia remsis]
MSLSRRITEAPAGVRWHRGRLATSLLYRRAFRSIGRGSVVVAPRVLRGVDRISIGDGVAVYAGAWLAAEGPDASVTIGDRTYLGHDVHVHSIDPVTIGSDCVLADGVFVASTDHGRGDRSATHGTGPITIGDGVFLGQRAVVLGGVTVGNGATVGAHAVVTRDVAPGEVVVGVPAKPVVPADPEQTP